MRAAGQLRIGVFEAPKRLLNFTFERAVGPGERRSVDRLGAHPSGNDTAVATSRIENVATTV
ncbi:hypothetical protein EGT50_02355 [Rhodococcus xishaensis]|uniref:Uncharacterized protein n=1 Tax=Rhodococcus xishaensis TaxID=2487364 RepID=A0A438B3E2_9NOCA|nr:hypothetical protein EGT50_02355 [Rhodococcus xishaensis]